MSKSTSQRVQHRKSKSRSKKVHNKNISHEEDESCGDNERNQSERRRDDLTAERQNQEMTEKTNSQPGTKTSSSR